MMKRIFRNKSSGQPFMGAAVPAVVVGAMAFGIPSAWAQNDHFCSDTARMAFKACRYEVRDDFWIAKANCINVSDSQERAECKRETSLEHREARALCGEQFEARLAANRFSPR